MTESGPKTCPPGNVWDEKAKKAELAAKGMEQSFLNYDRRRACEWKLSISIWTALAAFIAILVKDGEKLPDLGCLYWVLMGVGIWIFLAHCGLMYGIWCSNTTDKQIACEFQKVLWDFTTTDKAGDLKDHVKHPLFLESSYGPLWQCVITGLLIVLAGVALATFKG